jgi:hypothetical protein
MSWMTRAEAAIRALRDVEGASIEADGDEIREIHVLSSSNRPAKQIVRDVQAVLRTRFQRAIDHRVVSVAFSDPIQGNGEKAPDEPSAVRTTATPDRIRFESVNLYVAGRRAQAQVELRWKGVPRMGSAAGWSTRDGSHRLVATATLATVQEFLDEDLGLSLVGVEMVKIGKLEVAVVALDLLTHREQKNLVGSCTVEEDAQQAVVLATLSAMNRIVGGLRTKEPTEYILRPTST